MTDSGGQLEQAEAHPHSHSDVAGGWLRAAVFGAMDGLVTNTALVAGVGGGGIAPHGIVLAGVATTVRDTRGQDIDGACGQLAAASTDLV
jgi:VIT1/CCC1 family predicted Fe2+/Mn2+ transporter